VIEAVIGLLSIVVREMIVTSANAVRHGVVLGNTLPEGHQKCKAGSRSGRMTFRGTQVTDLVMTTQTRETHQIRDQQEYGDMLIGNTSRMSEGLNQYDETATRPLTGRIALESIVRPPTGRIAPDSIIGEKMRMMTAEQVRLQRTTEPPCEIHEYPSRSPTPQPPPSSSVAHAPSPPL